MSWLFPTSRTSQDATQPTFSPDDTSSSASPSASSSSTNNFDFSTVDTKRLHPLAGLNETLEYLVLEDAALNSLPGSQSALPSRGWSDDLCYGTGTTYLSGLAIGGTYGAYEGLQRASQQSTIVTPRLRLNYVLNAVTRRGPFLGNSLGVVAIIYNGINSSIGALRGRHDIYNSVAAGTLAGALFKCTRGVRPAMIFGGLAGSAALVWSLAKQGLTKGSPQEEIAVPAQ